MTILANGSTGFFLQSINELVTLLLLDNESAGIGSVHITKAMQNYGG